MNRHLLWSALFLLVACEREAPDPGSAPTVVGDLLSATRSAPATTEDVLANDSGHGALHVVSWTDGAQGRVTYDGAGHFTWTPRVSSASGADAFQYTVMDDGGGRATATVTVSIAPGWGIPEPMTDAASTWTSAAGPDGTSALVWLESDGVVTRLWGTRRDPATGLWTAPSVADAGDAGTPSLPRVAVDAGGNVMAAWRRDAGVLGPWTAALSASGTWSAPAAMGTGSTSRSPDSILLRGGPAGFFVATWLEYDGVNYDVWSASTDTFPAWGTAARIESYATIYSYYYPALAVDSAGNAVAAWLAYDNSTAAGYRYNVWANRRPSGGSWGTAAKLEATDNDASLAPALVVDGSGNAVAAWVQSDGTFSSIYAARMTSAGSWGAATLLESQATNVAGSVALAETQGTVTAAWRQRGTTYYDLWTNRMSSGGSWGTATRLDTEDLGDVQAGLTASADGQGYVTVGWLQYNGVANDVWAARAAPAGSWSPAQKLDGSADTATRLVAAAAGSRTTLLWNQAEGPLQTIRYSAFDGAWGAATDVLSGTQLASVVPSSALGLADGAFVLLFTEHTGSAYVLRLTDYR